MKWQNSIKKPYMDITFARFRISRDIWDNMEDIEKVEFVDVFEKKVEEAAEAEIAEEVLAEEVLEETVEEEVLEEIAEEVLTDLKKTKRNKNNFWLIGSGCSSQDIFIP